MWVVIAIAGRAVVSNLVSMLIEVVTVMRPITITARESQSRHDHENRHG
jgi:hypothetical protein